MVSACSAKVHNFLLQWYLLVSLCNCSPTHTQPCKFKRKMLRELLPSASFTQPFEGIEKSQLLLTQPNHIVRYPWESH